MEGSTYYIVHESAMPPVLKKVAEANRLLSSGEARTVNEAAEMVGIGRSSYYKFKDSVEEFHNDLPGSMLTIVCEVSDRAGILSDLLQTIAQCGANILTIHQAIPVVSACRCWKTQTVSIRSLRESRPGTASAVSAWSEDDSQYVFEIHT